MYANIDDCILPSARRSFSAETETEVKRVLDEPATAPTSWRFDAAHNTRGVHSHRQRTARWNDLSAAAAAAAAKHKTDKEPAGGVTAGSRGSKPPIAARPAVLAPSNAPQRRQARTTTADAAEVTSVRADEQPSPTGRAYLVVHFNTIQKMCSSA